MANKNFNMVNSFVLRVQEQKKNANGTAIMKCLSSGGKKNDGTYERGMFITVIFDPAEIEWQHEDLTGKWIDVDGQFKHSYWEKEDRGGLNFTIFATAIRDHEFESTEDEKKPKKQKW